MADNVTLPLTGSGDATAVVATDEVGSAHYQYNKLAFGADGTATKVSSSDPLPVSLPAATVTTLTPPAAITGFALEAGNIATAVTRLTSILAALPAALAAGGGLKVEGVSGGVTVPVTNTPSTASSANNSGSQVALSTSAATLLASFATRKGALIVADSDMFVKFGSGATTSAFKVEAGQPLNLSGCLYTGIITAILASGTGTAYVMEW